MFLSLNTKPKRSTRFYYFLFLFPPPPISLYETRLSFQLGPQTSSSQHVRNDRFNFIMPTNARLRSTKHAFRFNFIHDSLSFSFRSSFNVETIDIILPSNDQQFRNTYFVSISSTNFFPKIFSLGTSSKHDRWYTFLPSISTSVHVFRFDLSSIPSFLQFCSELLAGRIRDREL